MDLPPSVISIVYRTPIKRNDNIWGTSLYEPILAMALECTRRHTMISEAADINGRPIWVEDLDEASLLAQAAEFADMSEDAFKKLDIRERVQHEAAFRAYRQAYGAFDRTQMVRGAKIETWNNNISAQTEQITLLEQKMNLRVGLPEAMATHNERPASGVAIEQMTDIGQLRAYNLREEIRVALEEALEASFTGATVVWGKDEPETPPETPQDGADGDSEVPSE